jgi:nucleoside 2-deoxyribosyltransferase
MRCFLSYSYKTDISVIKKLLADHNISYINPVESLEYGSSILPTISRQMKDSDFVFAIFDDSTNVSFELGMAIASKKPIFIIVGDKNEQRLPNYIEVLTYTLAKPTDYDKIKYSFDLFLNNLPFKKDKIVSDILERKPRTKKEFKGKKLSRSYVQSLRDLDSIRGIDFERFVGEIFRKLELEVLTQNRTKEKDFIADFSIWIDELNSIIGNPIIVETKSITPDKGRLRDSVEKLSYYLKKYNSKVALLIYNNPRGVPVHDLFSYSPLVLSISIQELLDKLTEKTLPEIILELRNNAVHKEIY